MNEIQLKTTHIMRKINIEGGGNSKKHFLWKNKYKYLRRVRTQGRTDRSPKSLPTALCGRESALSLLVYKRLRPFFPLKIPLRMRVPTRVPQKAHFENKLAWSFNEAGSDELHMNTTWSFKKLILKKMNILQKLICFISNFHEAASRFKKLKKLKKLILFV